MKGYLQRMGPSTWDDQVHTCRKKKKKRITCPPKTAQTINVDKNMIVICSTNPKNLFSSSIRIPQQTLECKLSSCRCKQKKRG
jgi:hypothetical protein